jgi:hypothetical protein
MVRKGMRQKKTEEKKEKNENEEEMVVKKKYLMYVFLKTYVRTFSSLDLLMSCGRNAK